VARETGLASRPFGRLANDVLKLYFAAKALNASA
jgi:hypothetical protein